MGEEVGGKKVQGWALSAKKSNEKWTKKSNKKAALTGCTKISPPSAGA